MNDPSVQPDPWAAIADELERVADEIRTLLVGQPAPGSFQLNVQPHNADGYRTATVKGRPETVAAVDEVANALLGKPAETYSVSGGGFHHGVHGSRGRVSVSIYQSVADPDAVDPEAELARLREENAKLRAAAALTPDADLAGLRVPAEDATLTPVPPTDPDDLPGYDPQFGEPGYPGCPGCGKTVAQHAPGCREDES